MIKYKQYSLKNKKIYANYICELFIILCKIRVFNSVKRLCKKTTKKPNIFMLSLKYYYYLISEILTLELFFITLTPPIIFISLLIFFGSPSSSKITSVPLGKSEISSGETNTFVL